MLYTIEFYQGKTDADNYGAVVHTLQDYPANRAIITLTLGADKLQGVSNYTREPKRLVFECFTDTWLQDYLLSGSYEHERYISHYELRASRDGVVVFTGIIDTSQCSYDHATGIVKISAYDRLKLFSIYSDLDHSFTLMAGYFPGVLVTRLIQDIQARIPVALPFQSAYTNPTLTILSADLRELAYIDYSDLLEIPAPVSGWTYSLLSPQTWQIRHGYYYQPFSQVVCYVAAIPIIARADRTSPASTVYQARFRGRVYTFFNRTAPVIADYDVTTEWRDTNDFINEYADFNSWFATQGISPTALANLSSTYTVGGSSYASGQAANLSVWANFYGNALPTRLHVGRYYEATAAPNAPAPYSATPTLKAIQAMLMLWNTTLVSTPAGVMRLISKDGWLGTAIAIDDDDVVAYSVSRSNLEKPDTSILDVFSGDTRLLQSIVADYQLDFQASQFTAQITIDNLVKYNLNLQSIVQIRGISYGITELEADPINDEWKVKAWQL